MGIKSISLATIALVLSTSANSALIERLGGLAYYDDVADLTWLADANYAETSGYAAANATGSISSGLTNIQADGRMGWQAANDWAAQLTVGGVGGWRLANTLQPDPNCTSQHVLGDGSTLSLGLNCTGSDMGALFYNALGNTAGSLTNAGPFSNVLPTGPFQSASYWSATEAASDTSFAWQFLMSEGSLSSGTQKPASVYAWAVQSGDVSAVPVPSAVWLFGSGLLGLIGVVRRKKA